MCGHQQPTPFNVALFFQIANQFFIFLLNVTLLLQPQSHNYEKFISWANGSEYQKDFENCEKISIDYAVMEKADNVVVKQASFQWNDLGTLGALYEITMKDFRENVISTQGKLQLDESDQNLIFCDDNTEIRLEKLKNCAVIKSGKALLITTKW